MYEFTTQIFRDDMREAGNIALRSRIAHGDISENKSGEDDVVTPGDKAVALFWQERLPERFPGIRTVNEEFAKSHGVIDDDVLTADIDPIDGSKNYRDGNPNCAISVGFSRGNVPLAGVVYQFDTGKMYWADKAGPAFCDGKTIWASSETELSRARVFYSMPYEHRTEQHARMERIIAALTPHVASCQWLGSQVIEMMQIAQGTGDIFLMCDTPRWDMGASVRIVRAANGIVVDMCGKPYLLGEPTIIATNGVLKIEPLVELIRKAA